MMKKLNFAVIVVTILMSVGLVNSAEASNRTAKRIGLGVGFLSEPMPSLVGYNLSYNLFSQLRLTAGYGSVSATAGLVTVDVTTIAAAAKLFLVSWGFAPYASVGFSNISGTVSGAGVTSGVPGLGSALTVGGGIDWQTGFGLNLGVDAKYLMLGSGAFLPGFYLGWFF